MAKKFILESYPKLYGLLIISSLLCGLIFFVPVSTPLQDVTPPEIKNVLHFPDPPEAAEPLSIMCNVTDNIAVHTVEVIITAPDGILIEEELSHLPPSFYYYIGTYSLPGIYTYYIRANDTSGNTQTTDIHSFHVLDTMPPLVDLTYPTGGENIHGTVNITWTALDKSDLNLNGDIILSYSNDGGTNYTLIASGEDNDGTYDFDTTLLPDGTSYRIQVNATDSSDNTGTDSSTANFTIDNTPPQTTPTLVGPQGQNGWYTDTVTIYLDAIDNTSGVTSLLYKIDNGSWMTYEDSFSISSEGNHTLTFYATDAAGNHESHRTINIKIDGTDPLVSITKPLPGTLYIMDREIISLSNEIPLIIGTITVTVESPNETSGISLVEFSLDYKIQENVSQEPWIWTWDDTVLIPRKYHLIAKIYDWAGHSNLGILAVRKWL